MPGHGWSESEEGELRRLFESGQSYRQIAREVGHSLHAVTGKLHRLGLGRPAKNGQPGAGAPRVLQRAGKVTLPELASLREP